MKSSTGRIILLLSILFLAASPLIASAQVAKGIWPTGYWGPLVSCTGNIQTNGSGGNPANLPTCTSVCDLIGTFVNIIYFAISICFFILAPIFFAGGGIMIMVSGANPEMLSKGKSVLVSTVIGIAIILCSYLLVFTFVSIFNATSNGSAIFGTISCTPQYPASQ